LNLARIMNNSKIRLQHFFTNYFTNYESLIIGEDGNNIGFLAGKKNKKLTLDNEFLDSLNDKTLLAGWTIRNWYLVSKWKDVISQNLINSLKKKDSIIDNYSIGVHIRGTDFKNHADGELYFEDSDWVKALNIIENNLLVNNVILMSDELQNWDEILKGNGHWKVSNGSFGSEGNMFDSFSDLLNCDIILTSGSTFALMAAWISNSKVIDVSKVEVNMPINPMEFEEWSKHKNFLLNWK